MIQSIADPGSLDSLMGMVDSKCKMDLSTKASFLLDVHTAKACNKNSLEQYMSEILLLIGNME